MSRADLISVAEAIRILDAASVSPRVERISLREAMGCCLADEIAADRDYPPFDKSLMDGFAVRAADVSGPGADLQVIETLAAGAVAEHAVGAGQAAAIMTGASLPAGADAVVPVEETARSGDRVTIHRSVNSGAAIARRGSEIESGRVVLTKGMKLGPAQIAVAASVGATEVAVFARPRVAVLSTGDEVVGFEKSPGPSQLRDCNSIMLAGLLRRLDCEVVPVGHVRDDRQEIADQISRLLSGDFRTDHAPPTRGLRYSEDPDSRAIDPGLRRTSDPASEAIRSVSSPDALFITGGMSMGEFDFVPRVLTETFGATLLISKLRIKPGKPFLYAQLRSGAEGPPCHVFGLPGNPVSGFVCTLRLASRVIRRMGGGSPDATILQAKLVSPLPANGPREFYQPAIHMGLSVDPLQWKSSGDIFTLANANALIIRPESAPPAAAGDLVPMIDLMALS